MKKIIILNLFIFSILLITSCFESTSPEEKTLIVVNSNPQGAAIIIRNDSTTAVTPATLEIDPGTHHIWLVLDGYQDYFEEFIIAEGETYTINTDLVQAIESATLIVSSIPSGAIIYLDGALSRWITPATLEIDVGSHELRLELDGYQDYVETFNVGDGETHTVNATMTIANNATLIVNSVPAGATIYLDGDPAGIVTPATLEIDTGNHELRLELTGYQDYVETFNVGDGDTYTVNATMAVVTNTSLSVYTTPSGASVYIDGAYTGELTPITFTDILPGDHQVRIYKVGYNEVVHNITLLENIPYTINEVLTAPVSPYPVFTFSEPSNGEHFTDNVIEVDGYIELDNGSPFGGTSAILSINGIDSEINVDYYGNFYVTISIGAGENYLMMRANSANGDTGVSDVITVYGNFNAPDIEIVLWWNTPTSDIDLHAWNPAGEHCYYGNNIISDGILDIDDVEGYGPETFSVQSANMGVYEIQVNCYSLDQDDYADASIQVFFDGVLMETYGPHHFIVADYYGTDPEAWWEVCTIIVTNGRCMISNDKPTQIVQEKIRLDKINLPRK
ncbi:MAG: PEGA domain-containing protein [Candidatus Tenebribacter davisii]|nr:PEGA domain-containing protein [Candidatus Tenebribacter davisii]